MIYQTLAEAPQHITRIASWYLDEWGYLKDEATRETETDYVREYLNPDCVPMILCAVEDDQLAGVVQLKFHEMKQYPDFEHWLGGVYVAPAFRGRNVATDLVSEILKYAHRFGIDTLYLQTINLTGGLYAQLGWQPVDQTVNNDLPTLVMARHLNPV